MHLLAKHGHLDELRGRVSSGDNTSAFGWPICWLSKAG